MRAVIDTNVLLSGLLWHGPPHTLIELIRNGALALVSSPALIAEFTDTINRPKFRVALSRCGASPDHMIAELCLLAELIDPPPLPAPASRDRDDDAVLSLAVRARTDLIISGDGDLLVLGAFANIPIVAPAQALAIVVAAPA